MVAEKEKSLSGDVTGSHPSGFKTAVEERWHFHLFPQRLVDFFWCGATLSHRAAHCAATGEKSVKPTRAFIISTSFP